MMPRIEVWTEIRCPACVPCGWADSRLLFKIEGEIPRSEAKLQTRCHRCKSIVEWQIGTPRLVIMARGEQNRKPMRAVFE